MVRHRRRMPLLGLLVQLGWQRDTELWTVGCRDGHGRRARLLVQLTAAGICLTVPEPGPLQLTALQVGRLRAALRDAILTFGQLASPDGPPALASPPPACPPPLASGSASRCPRGPRSPSCPPGLPDARPGTCPVDLMCAVAPLTISGWQTIIATVVVILLTLGYGELRARDTPQRPQGRHHNPPPREPANPQPPRRPSATTAEDNPV